jgi:hypothetical protein
MLYLEKLTLYLCIKKQGVFIDPIHLINEFSIYMQRLNSFNFYLSTENKSNDLVHYLSNNDAQRTYMNIGYREVSSIVCFAVDIGVYHIFTLPFQFEELGFIGSIFPNIVFNYVIRLWVRDRIPFGHEFFLRLAQAVPLLENLHVTSLCTKSYDAKKSSDDVQSYQIVEYPHLTSLDILRTDTHYIEQFIDESKTYLPCLTELTVLYEKLRIITNNFTRESTRHNCANVKRLIFRREIVGSKDFHTYFPSL